MIDLQNENETIKNYGLRVPQLRGGSANSPSANTSGKILVQEQEHQQRFQRPLLARMFRTFHRRRKWHRRTA